MGVYLEATCDDCGQVKRLLIGGGPENTEDVIAFCIACLRTKYDPQHVLDMVEAGDLSVRSRSESA